MAIDGGMRKQLAAGMRLVASYRKETHTAEVIEGEDGRLRFKLADGREFTSPSAAASAVMGGVAANGWRFWSLQTEETEAPAKAPAKQPRAKATKAAKPASRAKAQAKPETEQPDGEPAQAADEQLAERNAESAE